MQALLYIISFFAIQVISFYSLSVKTVDGNSIPFNDFAGKKVLFVNTATGSSDTAQFAGLEQLYQLYKDSLVIIAVPSNNFGNEPLNNTAIKTNLQSRYNVHYMIAEKQSVSDSATISPIYKWFSSIEQNGMMESRVRTDFYKYLVNKDGKLVGVFSDKVTPMDSTIQNAILE